MTTLISRGRSPLADMFGWLDTEGSMALRSLGLAPLVHLEDYMEEDTYVLRAEMPGLDPDKDFEISVDGDVLTISGERTEEHKDRNRREFHYGSFSRSIELPPGAKVDDLTAEYRDGVLELRVPIDDDGSQPRRIPITKADA